VIEMTVLARTESGISVERMTSRAEFQEASALYADVFGYGDGSALNTRLLRAITRNGGMAVGARSVSGVLAGFAYAFPAIVDGEVSLYSQAAFVRASMQGRGVGRVLKEAQRVDAISRGFRSMKWSFDPALARNAYFNFNVLGTTASVFEPDYYDDGASDRLIVEWHFDVERSAATAVTASAAPLSWGAAQRDGGITWVTVPRNPAAVTPEVRGRLSVTLKSLLVRGGRVVACSAMDADTSAYEVREAGD
jgi:predicted GNAT superfamily acetyltransferase